VAMMYHKEKKRTGPLITFIILMFTIVVVFLFGGLSGYILNDNFTIQVSGEPGVKFSGFYTNEVKYPVGSRTEGNDIQGTFSVEKTAFEFSVRGIEISCKISASAPEKPVTVVLFRDGEEVGRIDGILYDGYLDWYPPVTANSSKEPFAS
jgi:hypothetical protein